MRTQSAAAASLGRTATLSTQGPEARSGLRCAATPPASLSAQRPNCPDPCPADLAESRCGQKTTGLWLRAVVLLCEIAAMACLSLWCVMRKGSHPPHRVNNPANARADAKQDPANFAIAEQNFALSRLIFGCGAVKARKHACPTHAITC